MHQTNTTVHLFPISDSDATRPVNHSSNHPRPWVVGGWADPVIVCGGGELGFRTTEMQWRSRHATRGRKFQSRVRRSAKLIGFQFRLLSDITTVRLSVSAWRFSWIDRSMRRGIVIYKFLRAHEPGFDLQPGIRRHFLSRRKRRRGGMTTGVPVVS